MKTLFTCVILVTSHLLFGQEPPTITWEKSLGGSYDDIANSIQQTSDGGYIMAGFAGSDDGDVSGYRGGGDMWVVKLNSSGSKTWQRCMGGFAYDKATSIQQTSDGRYVVAGYTNSTDGNVSGNHGGYDAWVVILNSSGSITWKKCLGGTGSEEAHSIQQTSDGGYIVAGSASSNDGDVSGNHGGLDAWVVKLDSLGSITWQRCLGGSKIDKARSIQQTSDGGYIVAGSTSSNDGDVSGIHGSSDFWVMKLDSSGSIAWQRCMGGIASDEAHSIQQTSDGGYVVAGWTGSLDGDLTGCYGDGDFWVVKLNSLGHFTWHKCLGGFYQDAAYSIQQTSDGGYIVGGLAQSIDNDVTDNHGFVDFWVVKLDPSATITWQKCLGGSSWDAAYSIQQTSDGGYIVAGESNSNDGDVSGNHSLKDFWVVKLGTTISGISEVAEPVITISPNPVSDMLTITSDRKIDSYKIANVDGRVIRSESIDADNWSVDMSGEVPGIYFMVINDGIKLQSIKFLMAN